MISKRKIKPSEKATYQIDSDKFIINAASKKSRCYLSENSIQKVIKHSLKENNIIEIYELNETKSVTKFYDNLMPMVIIEQNNFYENELFINKAKLYKEFIYDFNRVSNLYNEIVDCYIDFIKNTNCYFDDMSGNNILIDSNYDKFKIIDVFSINEVDAGVTIKFSPLSIMSCLHFCPEHHGLGFKLDGVLNRYLDGIDMFHLYSEIISKINVRTFKV